LFREGLIIFDESRKLGQNLKTTWEFHRNSEEASSMREMLFVVSTSTLFWIGIAVMAYWAIYH